MHDDLPVPHHLDAHNARDISRPTWE